MKILLVRPKPHRHTIGLQDIMICEPLELMTLRAVLEANSHTVQIADMILEKRPLGDIVQAYAPDIVGLTGYISHVNIIKEYARTIKQCSPATQVYCGGVHATVCPADFAADSIDGVCTSAEDFYCRCGCTDTSYKKPNRQLPPEYRSRYYYLFHQNCALIKTSFGCPYSCSFCFCRQIAPYSAREIDEVIEELEAIEQDEVYIVDDDFLFNEARLSLFCDKLEQRGIKKRYLVYGRADFIAHNDALMARLKANGLRAVIVGIEAATQEELDAYNKRTAAQDNMQAVRVLQKHDIDVYATVILGVDWNTKDFKRLYQYLKQLGVVFVNLQPFTPMPATEHFEEYRSRLIVPYAEHEKWDMAHLVVKPGRLSVRRYYFQIIKLYFMLSLSPSSTFYMVRRFGLRDCLKLSRGAAKITRQYLGKMLKG